MMRATMTNRGNSFLITHLPDMRTETVSAPAAVEAVEEVGAIQVNEERNSVGGRWGAVRTDAQTVPVLSYFLHKQKADRSQDVMSRGRLSLSPLLPTALPYIIGNDKGH